MRTKMKVKFLDIKFICIILLINLIYKIFLHIFTPCQIDLSPMNDGFFFFCSIFKMDAEFFFLLKKIPNLGAMLNA